MTSPQSLVLNCLPISVNAAYRNVPKIGRVKTTKYKNWQKDVGAQLSIQGLEKVCGEVEVSIFCRRPDKRKRDIDNLVKAVLDLLVAHNLIEDDRNVVKVSAQWTTSEDIEGTLVLFEEWKE